MKTAVEMISQSHQQVLQPKAKSKKKRYMLHVTIDDLTISIFNNKIQNILIPAFVYLPKKKKKRFKSLILAENKILRLIRIAG